MITNQPENIHFPRFSGEFLMAGENVKTISSLQSARKSGLPIMKKLPKGYITYQNAKQLGIKIERKKDAFLRFEPNKCVAIWNMKTHPELNKPMFIEHYSSMTDNLFTKNDAKNLFMPIKKGETPSGYITYSTKTGESVGSYYEYIPLYKRENIKTQHLVRKMIKTMEVKNYEKANHIGLQVKLEGNIPRKNIMIELKKRQDGSGFNMMLKKWTIDFQTSEMSIILAIATKLFTGTNRTKLLTEGLHAKNIFVTYQEIHNPNDTYENWITVDDYLKIPLYEI